MYDPSIRLPGIEELTRDINRLERFLSDETNGIEIFRLQKSIQELREKLSELN